MHLLELPNFQRDLKGLSSPLDFWLYFLKNGVTLDADQLPAPLDTHELRQAMEVLKMFSQDEMARELYEGRLKAKRDAKMWEMDRHQALAKMAEAEQRQAEAEQRQAEAEQLRAKAEQRGMDAERKVQQELACRIQLCERLLRQSVTDTAELLQRDPHQLRELAGRLEQALTRAAEGE